MDHTPIGQHLTTALTTVEQPVERMVSEAVGLLLRRMADRDEAMPLLAAAATCFAKLRHLWADAGHRGRLVAWSESGTVAVGTAGGDPAGKVASN